MHTEILVFVTYAESSTVLTYFACIGAANMLGQHSLLAKSFVLEQKYFLNRNWRQDFATSRSCPFLKYFVFLMLWFRLPYFGQDFYFREFLVQARQLYQLF